MGVNSLPKTVTRERRDCDLNPCPSAPESSTLTTRLPSPKGRFVYRRTREGGGVGLYLPTRGVVVSGVRRMNEVNARPTRLVPGRVTVFGRVYTVSVCNKPTRSTQPCIPPGSLSRVPASAGVRAGMSPLPGGR